MTRIALSSVVPLVLVSIACDDPLRHDTPASRAPTAPVVTAPPDLVVSVPAEPVAVDDPEDLPFLVSRFSPHQGLTGTELTLLVAFDSHGCAAAGTCRVTVGGAVAEITRDAYDLEVIVPEDAETGAVCVTWYDRSECGGAFVVLPGPVLYTLWPDRLPAEPGDTPLSLRGDGFAEDAEVWLDWQPIATTWSSQRALEAVAPASLLTPGQHELFVYSASSGRCGLSSESRTLVVE